MDAYLICPETRKSLWLGKPIRHYDAEGKEFVSHYNRRYTTHNHEDPILNKMLWKFLAEHAHKELRVVFDWEFKEHEYQRVEGPGDIDEYVENWPPELTDPMTRLKE